MDTQAPIGENMDVLTAISERRSFRAFLDLPVKQSTVEKILETARWAPSGGNSQPWKVCVVTEETKQKLSEALIEARALNMAENPDYKYYPASWFEPFKRRQIACGMAMYKALGILRKSPESRVAAWNRNYSFFGAPTVLFFLIHNMLAQGSWLDYGMFIQNIVLAARNYKLETCVQAATADYPDLVRKILNIDSEYIVLCSICLGYPDFDEPINQFRTEREEVNSFTSWYR